MSVGPFTHHSVDGHFARQRTPRSATPHRVHGSGITFTVGDGDGRG